MVSVAFWLPDLLLMTSWVNASDRGIITVDGFDGNGFLWYRIRDVSGVLISADAQHVPTTNSLLLVNVSRAQF